MFWMSGVGSRISGSNLAALRLKGFGRDSEYMSPSQRDSGGFSYTMRVGAFMYAAMRRCRYDLYSNSWKFLLPPHVVMSRDLEALAVLTLHT